MSKHSWICMVLVVSLAASAGATLTPEQKCRKQVGVQGGAFLNRYVRALQACHEKVSRASLPAATDCLTETTTAAKILKHETTLTEKVTAACPDAVVPNLVFGGECYGSATAADLVTCLLQSHEAQALAMVDTAYATTGMLELPERTCQRTVGKEGIKLAKAHHDLTRNCKNKIETGALPMGTDCAALNAAKLTTKISKANPKIVTKCPDALLGNVAFGAPCAAVTTGAGLAACDLGTHSDRDEQLIVIEYGTGSSGRTALAKAIDSTAECVGGPLSRCRVGDYLLKNDKIRVVVQGIQRNMFGIGQFGGQIIDADLVRAPGDPDRDNFEEWATSINIENTAHYTSITVVNDGSDGQAAIIRASGVDDVLDFINPSSVVAGYGFPFPSSADDRDLPVEIVTDYILEPGRNYVRVDTTVHNIGSTTLVFYFGEFINASGQVAEFQPGYGFGEPMVTTRCASTAANPCNAIAYAGFKDAEGVSYGYINDVPASSTFTTSGVSVPLIGTEVLLALIGSATPPHVLAEAGTPWDSKTFTRHFIVGDGTVSSILDTRNKIHYLPTGMLQGTVTAGGSPAPGAQVVILGDTADGPGLSALTRNVITHTQADATGHYALTVAPGSYNVIANLEGYPYEGGGTSPVQHAVTLDAFATTTLDIALPATGALAVTAVDEAASPIAAKVSVVGFDPSPDPQNSQDIFGLISNTTGVFNDISQDGLTFGLAQVLFAGPSGSVGPAPLEPGDYRVVVSHGSEYSAATADITVTADATASVNAQVARVTDSTGFISGDFHVHSIDSADSKISRRDRVISMLAEGMDFFTPSDHDFRSDFVPTIDELGVTALIKTATSAEITTFDYGHFNAWPVPIDSAQVNGGSVDFGRAAPAGEDFPSFGNYNLSPAEIIAAARADGATTVQINHIHSYFGLESGSGLAIDTGLTPPQSAVPGAARRLDPAVTNYFPSLLDRPDAFELWIGDDRPQIYTNFLGRNIGDWFNMLNQGIVKTGVADSDTHRRIITQSGMPHSMVASATDNPGELVPADVSQHVDEGRVFGTNAPIVRVSAHAASTGQSGGLEIGQSRTISTTDGEVDIDVDIKSPIWAEFDRVEYYVNTTTTKHTATKQSGAGLVTVTTYAITPDYVQNAGTDFTVTTVDVDPLIPGAQRLEASTTLSLSGLTEDIWVVVLVRGTDGVSRPLFPVVPNSLKASTNTALADLIDGNLGEDGMTALAFTNPLFVDVDGGGWSPPGVKVSP